ncbi:penicillin-binding transpeptidase domain-containing protein [Planctobacterium marinum]|uniref:penicillin-binding transpeptidase domain-containing protein n=1 Tax=Planctobacterium marinum TaxID=1631968 RepID=UPI001E6320C7|nr:penicillin-binding transpeptidase domain-containing protein [Planctobacterium marinum]MCC2603805.1 class D beta-lactamase [Planctobacterium marinum]
MKTAILGVFLWSFFSVANAASLCARDCAFVLKEQSGKSITIINNERVNQAFTPYSTFKIPNTLIALETGVVEDSSQLLSFDTNTYPIKDWWPEVWHKTPLNIRTAFQKSALPVYQAIATQIGVPRMQHYIEQFGYGNQDISSGLDSFWLNGSLKISAMQQVEFLQRMYSGQLPVSESALALFKQVMLVEQTEEYTLYAKTGGGPVAKDIVLGWYVGIVDRGEEVYYFALNMDGKRFSEIQQKRIDVARYQLQEAGVL